MKKIATHIDGLYYAQGDIFDIDGGNFDAIIVFIEQGFNDIQARFLQLKEELGNSPCMVVPFGNYVECPNMFSINQIPTVVFQVLDAVKNKQRKVIGFHGIRAIDASDYAGAMVTIHSIVEWLQHNRSSIESVTLVDRFNCYAEHFCL